MRPPVQQALIRRFRELRAARSTQLAPSAARFPAAEYTDRAQLLAERDRLFRGRPVVAALSADVRAPGDFLATEVDGQPLLVVRGNDGRAGVFRNACRHRAVPVAQGRGSAARGLTCPYHAWSYELDGRLRSQPLATGCFPEAECGALDLVALPADEAGGLVVTRLDGAGPVDAAGVLGAALAAELDSYGLATYSHVETRRQVRAMNWKMVVDTFLESYHIFSLHKGSIAAQYYSHPMLFDPFGPHFRLVGVRRSLDELEDDPSTWSLLPHATVHYCVFPSTLVVHQLDHFEVWRVFPLGDDPGQSVIETSLYAPSPPDTERMRRRWERNLDILLGVTDNEDFPQCEAAQRGLAAGAADSVVFGRNEPALVHFHEQVRRALAATAGDAGLAPPVAAGQPGIQ